MNPLVTVIIPCYNASTTIVETLQSVLNQTISDFEILVVDDGSRDDTIYQVQSINDPRINLIRGEHKGAARARNLGLLKARGKYIQYLDADDLLHTRKLELQVAALEGSAEKIAVSSVTYFFDGESPDRGRHSAGGSYLQQDDPLQFLIDLWTPGDRDGMIPPICWLTPREICDKAGPWNESLTLDDDGEYFSRVLLASNGTTWVPEAKGYYRKYRNPGSLSSRSDGVAVRSVYRIRRKREKMLETLPEGERRLHFSRVLGRQYLDLAYFSYPNQQAISALCEQKAKALGAIPLRLYKHNRLAYVIEKLLGWKIAKRLFLVRERFRKIIKSR